jgi:predicted dehydrogenase
MPSPTDRRTFLSSSAAAVAAATLPAAALPAGANDRLGVAVIGPGGMGGNHLKLLTARPDVRVVTVCDPDANRLAAAAKTVESAGGGAPKGVKDLRLVLDDKSVDAVWIM